MNPRTVDLLEEAIAVSAGRCAPSGTEAEYLGAALDFAASRTAPGETATERLARLIVSGSAVTHLLYEAAEKARPTKEHTQP